MSEKTHNFKVGIFVLVGLGLFVVALFALGLGAYFVEGDVFETSIEGGVENLSVGAVVKWRGVTIGKVTSIGFVAKEQPQYKDQSVLILFKVDRDAGVISPGDSVQQMLDVEVARGLRARIEAQGFLGPSIVMLEYVDPKLYPVTPVPWKPKHYYIPSAPSQFSHAFSALEKTLYSVEDLDWTELVNRTQKLIDMANRLVDNVNRVDFDRLGTNANELVVEVRETNRGLQRTLADARSTFTEAQHTLVEAQGAIKDADLPSVSRQAQALEARLTSAAIELRRLLSSVDTVELNASLANVRAATEDLTVLLHNVEQRPSTVLFSKPPKPASSVEEPPKK